MTTPAPFFVAGGSLPPDAPSYVERPADRILYGRVNQGELCYLLTPRRSGKSSLLLRLRQRLRHEGMQVAFVDLTMLGTSTSSMEEWFYGFCRSIARELALTESFESWWSQQLNLPATQRMVEGLRFFFLEQFAERLLVMVDEIETARGLAFGDDFFAAIRACFNARAQDREYARLNFVLSGVSTPADLIQNPRRTPFNIGFRVELTDFSMAEADGLVAGLTARCLQPLEVLERILGWTSGHPYLTQRLCGAASQSACRPDEIDSLVERELLSDEARAKEEHFKFVRERLLHGDRARSVLALYGRVLGSEHIEADPRSAVHDALKLSDLVSIGGDGCLSPRNRILAKVFDRGFVRRSLRWSRQTLAWVATASVAVLAAFGVFFVLLPLGHLESIDTAINDVPNQAYRELRSTLGWESVADEHFARYFDRRAMSSAQQQDRDRALLYALHADDISSTARRRAQAAALITDDLPSLERTFRSEDSIAAVAFSPDGDRVLTGSADNTARLWDEHTGKPLGALMQHAGSVDAVAFSPNGNRVLTGSTDNTARLWDARTGKPLSAPMKHEGSVNAVAFSPEGNRVLTGSSDKTARLWDARTGEPFGAPMKHDNSVDAVDFSPEGDRVLTGGFDDTARLWDARTGEPLGAPMQHGDSVVAVAFSSEGNRVLTGSGKTARLWDARTGEPLGAPMKHDGILRAVAFSPKGDRVLTGSWDSSARLWDARTGEPLGAPMKHDGEVAAVAFSPKGDRVLTGSSDGTARLWDAHTRKPLGTPMKHASRVAAVTFSPEGDRVLTGSWDSSARLWDARTGELDGTPFQHADLVKAVALSPEGDRVLTGSWDSTARLWDARTGEPVGTPMQHGSEVHAVAFSAGSDRVLTGSMDHTARLWDARTGEPVSAAMQHGDFVFAVAFSPEGDRALTGSWDSTAQLWDARTGEPVGTPMQHLKWVIAVTFSPEGDRVLTGSWDNTARLWDARTGEPIGTPMQHGNAVNALAFSPEGDRVLTGSWDNTARLWDARTGEPVGTPMQHGNAVSAVAFSPKGDRILTGSSDDTARLWDARTGESVGAPMQHGAMVTAIASSPDQGPVWTFAGSLAFQWSIESSEIRQIGVVSVLGSLVSGPQSMRVDPGDPAKIQFASSIGSSVYVREVDLSQPPKDFTEDSSVLRRSFEKKFGLKLLDDGEIYVPYDIEPKLQVDPTP